MIVMTASVFLTSSLIDQRSTASGSLKAQSIANDVVSMIIEASCIKQEMPDASFKKTLEIPEKIGSYDYFIEASDTEVVVKSKNGKVSESSSLLNIVNEPHIASISGTVDGSYYYVKIELDDTLVDETNPMDILIEPSYSR